MKKFGKRLVWVAIIVAVFIGWQLYKKNQAGEDVRSQTLEIIQNLPSYDTESEYLKKVFDQSYEQAFESSYKVGSRRRAAKLDAEKYLTAFFDNMIRHANGDGKDELVKEMEVYKIMLIAGNKEEKE